MRLGRRGWREGEEVGELMRRNINKIKQKEEKGGMEGVEK